MTRSLTLLSISYSWYDNVRWSDRRLIISEQVFRHSDHQVQFRGDNESLEILKSVPISVSNQFHGASPNSKSMDQFHGFQYPSLKRRKWLWTSFPLPFLVDFGWHWAYHGRWRTVSIFRPFVRAHVERLVSRNKYQIYNWLRIQVN